MTEFAKRHRDWTAEKDDEKLRSEVMECLKETKKRLDVHVEDEVISAEVEPEHLVEDLLAEGLAKQFPDHYVILESSRGTFAAGKGMAGVVRTQSSKKKLVRKLARN